METSHSATGHPVQSNSQSHQPLPLHRQGAMPHPEAMHVASIKQMVKEAHARGASDIHIRVGQVPDFGFGGKWLWQKVMPRSLQKFLRLT